MIHGLRLARRPLRLGALVLIVAVLPPAQRTFAEGGPETATTAAPEGAPIYCPVCGARNSAGSRFCLQDGTPLPTLDPARSRPDFVRSPDTFSPQEIQQTMDRVADSVLRVRVKAKAGIKFPVAYERNDWDKELGRALIGKLETMDSEARLSGSGFVIGPDGETVTNAHVANPFGLGADLTVETRDGRSFPARVLGIDPASDLALLKVETRSLAPLAWGNSDDLRTGEETWAIGNPLDIGLSTSRGTISGMAGMRTGLNQVEAFIHSDAYITQGNSGGPLVDVLGRVMGVSDMVFSEAKGQGYSIPARMAKLVIDRLRQRGRYERGFIGLHVRPVDTESIDKFGLKRTAGVVVDSVLSGSPAEAAGFRPGDVVFGINGRQATATYLLQEAVSSVGPGVALTLTLDRAGKVFDVPVQTALRPDEPHIDPILDMQKYLMVRFEEDPRTKQVVVRNPGRSMRAPGLRDGTRIKSVLPAQDWPDEPITLDYYKRKSRKVPVNGLEDLRSALARSHLGGRVGATFEVENPGAPIVSVAFNEVWPIIL
jgi:S1-C subfamily serine protease